MPLLPILGRLWISGPILLCTLGISTAQAISISPVRLTLEPSSRMVTVVLGNDSNKPVQVSVNVVRWQQDKGFDLQLKQNAFLASPQAFILPPNQLRPLRIGLVGELSGNDNEFYQVRISESRQDSFSMNAGTTVTMTHVLPLQVFRQPDRAVRAQCIRDNDQLLLENTGAVLVKGDKVLMGDSAVTQTEAWAPYVLPGKRQPIVLDTLDPATQHVIAVVIEGMEQSIACPQ